uniref:Uncharacterized protein n=1 Tax=Anguilla anguilla TaxID=7936 RepID=A0A0E9RAU9_ANGAN
MCSITMGESGNTHIKSMCSITMVKNMKWLKVNK